MKQTLFLIAPLLGVISLSSAQAAINGTSSLQATFTSTIEVGTCLASTQDAGGANTSTIDFGDIYKSDLTNKSRYEPFKINFSQCSGVKSASVLATPTTGGCSGSDSNGESYPAGNATAFEIWNGSPDSGTQMVCKKDGSGPAQTIALSSGSGSLDMNARIVVASGRLISDVSVGAVSTNVTFNITYQ